MPTFLLVRHGTHSMGPNAIPGRAPQAVLTAEGRGQAQGLAERLRHLPISAIHCSPVLRARQTAEPLSAARGLPVRVNDALAEIEYGDWTGQTLDDLRPLDPWKHWNAFRSGARVPGGEAMLEVQTRAVGEVLRLAAERPAGCVALVSHGDVIKAVLAYFLGVPLDLFQRMEVSTGSVSVVRVEDYGPTVWCVNNVGAVTVPG